MWSVRQSESRRSVPGPWHQNSFDAPLRNMKQNHERQHPDEPFQRPRVPRLAVILMDAGYKAPNGNAHWWPAQVQQLLEGRFDDYYEQSSQTPVLRD